MSSYVQSVSAFVALIAGLCLPQCSTFAQGDTAAHTTQGHESPAAVEKPKVFLDKTLRVVEYQLNRLSNAQLLLVDRATDDPKYAPVFSAILLRPGMAVQDRQQALAGLVAVKKTTTTDELFGALGRIDELQTDQRRVGRELVSLLLTQATATLSHGLPSFEKAVVDDNSLVRRAGLAGLITANQAHRAKEMANTASSGLLDLLAAIPLVTREDLRASLADDVFSALDAKQPLDVRKQAIDTLAFIPSKYADSFRSVAGLIADKSFTDVAVRTLLRIPNDQRDKSAAAQLAENLVQRAEATPAAERTSDAFVDAMQLIDSLLPLLPEKTTRDYRERLRAISVRVVRIQTVEEEMRYDIKFFAAEAGRPVQIVLRNEDLMPHNLVVTMPGALKEVALLAAAMPPDATTDGKQYVPASDKVLFATGMIQAGKQERLTFGAPQQPGEYPFVCTFPNHWMRMYGVMVVVSDLDAWTKESKPPADPIGNNRSLVKNWKVDDLKADLSSGLRGRTPEIGRQIYREATCLQCHKLRGEGGAVGPDLSDVFARWKGDAEGILRELVEPSHKIDPKYAAHSILTDSGKVYSGVIVAEDAATISLVNSPDQPAPTIIKRDEIDEMVKSPKSIMPTALLDQFTKDEIFELIAHMQPPQL